MPRLRNITVNYSLDQEEYERLEKITELYNLELENKLTPEKMFDFIMNTGSKHDIDKKLKFHEWKFDLIEDFD